jgi:CRISPR/Cas system-associated protein Csx1
VAVLTEQLQRIKERIADEKETIQRNRAIINRFLTRSDNIATKRCSNRDNTPTTNNSLTSHSTGNRVAKLLDPPLFSGEDRAIFDD